jgi:hypothetical protein
LIADTKSFVAAMVARGELRFAAPAPAGRWPEHKRKWTRRYCRKSERERAELKRRADGCRIYAQPFAGKLPERSDRKKYMAAYMRLARAAGKWKGNKL